MSSPPALRLLFALTAGGAVAAAIFGGFALYTWTAIHSGWSQAGINAFYAATAVVPLGLGMLAGIAVYRLTRRFSRR
jgi:asparagine N-glycosylation enzyme membrane subunit Stt3